MNGRWILGWEGVVYGRIEIEVGRQRTGFPGGSDGKESARNVGDLGSIPALGRSPREQNGIHSSILAWGIPWTEESGGL